MADIEADSQTDLRGYLLVLRRRKLIIAVTLVVVLGLALAYSFVKTPVYTATATVLVPEQQPTSALNVQNNQLQDPAALQRLLADAQQFAQGDAVKAAAAKAIGFTANVSIGVSTTADVLTFKASSTSPAEAAKIANDYAAAYISANRTNQVSQYTQQVTALESSIAALQAKQASIPPGSAQYTALQNSITALNQSVEQTQAAAQVVNQVGPSVVNAANVPTSPSSPNKTRNGILGVLVGGILGVGLAFLWERLDDGLTSREVVEQVTGGLPVVGLIPMVDAWKAKGSHHIALEEDPGSNIAEAYRTLRTALQFMSIDRPKRVIAVTSSVPGEGKSTLAANLAVSFIRTGQRVVLVSCDLRRPRIHDFFGLSNDVGLTSVLLGRVALSDAMLEVSAEPRLRVIPSGPIPPNPAEILSLDRIVQVIDSLADYADVVILDCPPVLPVSDTLLISRMADGVLVVASVQQTTTKQLHRTVELLEQVDAPMMGVALNRVPTENSSYGYEYGYYRADHYRSEEVNQLARSVVETEAPQGSLQMSEERRRRGGGQEPTRGGTDRPARSEGGGGARNGDRPLSNGRHDDTQFLPSPPAPPRRAERQAGAAEPAAPEPDPLLTPPDH